MRHHSQGEQSGDAPWLLCVPAAYGWEPVAGWMFWLTWNVLSGS